MMHLRRWRLTHQRDRPSPTEKENGTKGSIIGLIVL
jgi:hypothetical protein